MQIQHAAEFLFAMRCFDDSFALYALLLNWLNDTINPWNSIWNSVIVGCVCSATTCLLAAFAADLLEKNASKISYALFNDLMPRVYDGLGYFSASRSSAEHALSILDADCRRLHSTHLYSRLLRATRHRIAVGDTEAMIHQLFQPHIHRGIGF